MKSLITTTAIATILSLGAIGAQAHETNRAVGAGGYIHPTGPATGVWKDAPQSASQMR